MADKDFKDVNQKAVEEAADSSRATIEQSVSPAEKVFHQPADVGETEHGAGTDGPANYYSEQAGEDTLLPEEPQPEKQGPWLTFIKPIVVLVAICVVVSGLLAFTNEVTAPRIADNVAASANAVRQSLLPTASGFEDVTPAELPDGVRSMYKASNDVGYVIEASATGYGGQVPAMVAFDESGRIAGVAFLENDETPGLGQKVVTDESFAAQFSGRETQFINTSDIDKIASATISSGAATGAVNAAIELYAAEVLGDIGQQLTPEEQRAALLPGAGEICEVAVDAEGVTEAYAGDDGNFIIYAEAPGLYGADKPVTAAVALDENGVILGLWLDTSNESPGYGQEIDRNTGFIESFAGKTSADEVDTIAEATVSSTAVKQAVENALMALGAVKEAA